MREADSNWFSKWENQLPSPEELTPLTQTLITPDLALAFDIPSPQNPLICPSPNPSSNELDSSEFCSSQDEPARTLKRPRLVWTPQLHKRFVDAVAHLGIKNAVPKTIMQLMSVDGLTRENVASHLQKYRLYLKRMQGMSSSGGDTATDRLFASSPVPAQFLHPCASNSEQLMPFAPVNTYQNDHVSHQIVSQFYNHSPSGKFEHSFMRPPNAEDLEGNVRKVLTLFPDGDG